MAGLGRWDSLHRIGLEITEHAMIVEYQDLARMLAPLCAAGRRVAIDDAFAGYASLRHVVRMAPDIIKLELSIEPALADRR